MVNAGTHSSGPITLWVVEDDPHFRETLAALFDVSDAFACSQLFGSCEEALAHSEQERFPTQHTHPDVILLDINLPGMSGLQGIVALKTRLPEARIVMLTIRDEAETIFEAFRSGASGYLPKNASASQIQAAVLEAARGGTLMPAPVARRVLATLRKEPSGDYALSGRESDVLREMTHGKSQQAIADSLFVSRHTVNTHIQHIYEKLHVHSGIEAVAKALRERLV
jgi:DNA-binding NarL/FixJ family response regulator